MAKRTPSSYQLLRVVQVSVPVFRQERTQDGRGTLPRCDGTKHGHVIVFVNPEHPAFRNLAARALRSKTGMARVMGGAIKAQVQSATITDEGKEP